MNPTNSFRYFTTMFLLCYFTTAVNYYRNCPSPDVPEDGTYSPKQSTYHPGDRVTYSCTKNFALSGSATRTCNWNRAWSDSTPFCDAPVKGPYSYTEHQSFSKQISDTIDDDTNTCYTTIAGGQLEIYLRELTAIRTVRLYLEKGNTDIEIHVGLDRHHEKLCAKYDSYIARRQWVLVECGGTDQQIKWIAIHTNIAITICEIQMYTEDKTRLMLWYPSSVVKDLLFTKPIYRAVDNNIASCYSPAVEDKLEISLGKLTAIRTVRLYLEKGNTDIEIYTSLDYYHEELCAKYDGFIGRGQWVQIKCKNTWLSERISIKTKTNVTICEIQIYREDRNECTNPPEMTVDNGHFQISRSKATLICDTGYHSEKSELICRSNSWKYYGLKCDEKKQEVSTVGKKQKITITILTSVAGIAITIIFLLLGFILYLVRILRKKNVTVVDRSTDGNSAPCMETGNDVVYNNETAEYYVPPSAPPPPVPTKRYTNRF